MKRFTFVLLCTVTFGLFSTAAGGGQTAPSAGGSQPIDPITLPPVTVTAQKEPADVQRIPVSVTVVPVDWLQLGSTVSDAGMYSPNTYQAIIPSTEEN